MAKGKDDLMKYQNGIILAIKEIDSAEKTTLIKEISKFICGNVIFYKTYLLLMYIIFRILNHKY